MTGGQHGDSFVSRVLWDKSDGLADNFTGPHFLQRLVLVTPSIRRTYDSQPSGQARKYASYTASNLQILNADVEPRRYAAVVKDAQSVSLQVSIVTSAVQVHLLLHRGDVGCITILLLVMGLICIGQGLVRNLTGETPPAL